MEIPRRLSASEALAAFLDDVKQAEYEDQRHKATSQAVVARVVRQRRRIKRRKRRAWRTGWLSHREATENPLLVRVALELETQARAARRCALDHLAEIVGRIAEDCDVLSFTSILFFVTESETLKPAVAYNAARDRDWEKSIRDEGIVPWVARHGISRLVEDTGNERDYYPENPNSCSELAIPVIHDGTVLGVLNLEADRPKAFSKATLERIKGRVAELVPHLWVLRAVDSSAKQRCPWHPLVHGWDLHLLLRRLCQAYADELGSDSTTCTVWYVDDVKEELFAYATYGYDFEFRDQKTLAFKGSFLGQQVQSGLDTIVRFVPLEEESFVEKRKAAAHGIETGILAKVWSADGSSKLPIALINVYLSDSEGPENDGDRESVVETSLAEFARILSGLIAAYEAQLMRVATGCLDPKLAEQGADSPRAQLEIWLAAVCQVLSAPGGSVFGIRLDCKALACLATTGFERVVGAVPGFGPGERDESMDCDPIWLDPSARGHTLAAFYNSGRAVRRNRLSHQGEKGLPPRCPERGGSSRPEYIAGQTTEAGDHTRRRFLGCAILQRGEAVGVLRLVRPKRSFPFTKCDELLIELICRRVPGEKAVPDMAQVSKYSVAELVVEQLVRHHSVVETTARITQLVVPEKPASV